MMKGLVITPGVLLQISQQSALLSVGTRLPLFSSEPLCSKPMYLDALPLPAHTLFPVKPRVTQKPRVSGFWNGFLSERLCSDSHGKNQTNKPIERHGYSRNCIGNISRHKAVVVRHEQEDSGLDHFPDKDSYVSHNWKIQWAPTFLRGHLRHISPHHQLDYYNSL